MTKQRIICGVGIYDLEDPTILGYTETGKQIRCPFYIKWKSLLARCYNPNEWEKKNPKGYFKNRKYENCTVVSEWHTFSVFKSWMENQDWKGNHLDKDIIFPGNTVYGPDTCIFVPPHINTMLVDQKRGKLPYGVSYDKRANLYFIRIRVDGRKTTKGCWKTAEEAEREFLKFRYNEIVEEANKLTDEKVKNALINYAKIKYSGV